MSDNNKLARRIVAQGIGSRLLDKFFIDAFSRTAEEFCKDGRVVLALMEKCLDEIGVAYPAGVDIDKPLAIAIVEACLEALEQDDSLSPEKMSEIADRWNLPESERP